MSRVKIKDRWVSILRSKASEYEHTARTDGKMVVAPSIDAICNEIEAFFAGLQQND